MSLSLGPAKRRILFRPSSIGRWGPGKCPGSVMMCANITDSGSSEAAREGTAVHLMGEQALRNERQPIEWFDRFIRVEGYDIEVNEEMVEGAQMYVDHVRRLVASGAELEIEMRLSMALLDPSDPMLTECQGTSDAVAYWPQHQAIEIGDLKFGKGYMVPADAGQLKIYGLLAMLKYLDRGVQTIRTTVVQPRDPNEAVRVRSHDYDSAELWEFAGQVNGAMRDALQPNAPLVPGEEQCQWCAARGVCPALAQGALDLARGAFAQATPMHINSPMPSAGKTPELPDVSQASGEELGAWLDRRDMVNTWFNGVELRAAAACKSGLHVPGYKMVQRTGNRKWTDPDLAVYEIMKLGVPETQLWQPRKLRSPKMIENVLPKEKHEALASFVNRPDNGLALVRDSDKRPAATGVFGVAPRVIGNL